MKPNTGGGAGKNALSLPHTASEPANFPVNFTADAARRLVSIAQNGARCGVRTPVIRDTTKPLPHGFNIKDLEQAATVISSEKDAYVWEDGKLREYPFEIDEVPPNEKLNQIIRQTGEKARSGMTVKVPCPNKNNMGERELYRLLQVGISA
jgi:DNA segregation ATPase FtsK/SpoIIIE, S-DNA-T family